MCVREPSDLEKKKENRKEKEEKDVHTTLSFSSSSPSLLRWRSGADTTMNKGR